MNKKRILTGLFTVAGILVGVAAFGAFEGHVINVKAQIENALAVSPVDIDFGTVFPQEYLTHSFDIKLSDSFMKEDRADDVNYVIKQKAKPLPEFIEKVGELAAQEWCHSYTSNNLASPTNGDIGGTFEENCYPVLCEYLSKTPDNASEDDKGVLAFHDINELATGYLSKLTGDVADFWTVDLAVPCFGTLGDQCAQDWPEFVTSQNPNAGDPWAWTLPKELEHEEFACDLWVEVTGVSRSANLYYESGDGSEYPGKLMGKVAYDARSTDVLSGTVKVDDGFLDDGHHYILVLNGPRDASIALGSTNELLASKACEDYGTAGYDWDGWWMNYTDNTGDKVCPTLPDPLPALYEGAEGFYNFQFDVLGSDLEAGYDFSVGLTDGVYTEVQFLIKDFDQGWKTIAEHPATGEGNVSEINFVVE